MNPLHGRGGLGSGGGSSSGKNQGGEAVVEMFPSGLRVLVVDDDPTCLMILERMLRTCLYEGSKNHKDKIFNSVRFSKFDGLTNLKIETFFLRFTNLDHVWSL